MKRKLLLDFHSPCSRYVLSFEDDGKVAYAYLKHQNKIVGTVWLYNRCPTPDESEWQDRTRIPFANCKGYMSEEGRMTTAVKEKDVEVDWDYENEEPVAYVYVHTDIYGMLSIDDVPGYARFATKDGPLARVMEVES